MSRSREGEGGPSGVAQAPDPDALARLRHVLELVSHFATSPSDGAPSEVFLSEAARALVERIALHARLELEGQGSAPGTAVEASRQGHTRRGKKFSERFSLATASGPSGTLLLWVDEDQPLSDDQRTALNALATTLAWRLAQQRLASLAEEQRVAAEQLLATVSHELSSPLAAVLFNVELCVARVSQSADEVPRDWLENRLRRTRDAVSSVRNLVNGILGVAQIRSGRVALQLQQVDLSRVVNSALSRMADELEWSGCEVRANIQPSVTGTWDALKLEILVTNLISNAMKFGAEKPIRVTVRGEDGQATLIVTDHGSGIRPEQKLKLFQQFSRDARNKAPGTGLGLWIAHSYVEAHGGTIALTSEEGSGTTVTVTLPRSAQR